MYKHIYNHASSSQNWSKHHHHYHHQIPLPAPPDYHQEIRSGTRVLRRSKRPEHNLNVAPVVADIIHYDVPFAEKDGVVGKAFPKKLCRDIIDAMQRMPYSRQLFNGKAAAFDGGTQKSVCAPAIC